MTTSDVQAINRNPRRRPLLAVAALAVMLTAGATTALASRTTAPPSPRAQVQPQAQPEAPPSSCDLDADALQSIPSQNNCKESFTQQGKGRGKRRKGSWRAAVKDLKSNGFKHCSGRSCTAGTRCKFSHAEIKLVSRVPVGEGDKRRIETTVEADSKCSCR